MSIDYRTGDLFTTEAPALAHGVNTQGVMGGIAAQFAARYGGLERDYDYHCFRGGFLPGDIYVWEGTVPLEPTIYNLATQDAPGPNARIEWVAFALANMATDLRDRRITRVAMPRIGCGIGGLTWEQVEPFVATLAEHVDVEVWTLS
jgi:O-acetyl-ADP-ribose deacetylase (regulator of RNase III)